MCAVRAAGVYIADMMCFNTAALLPAQHAQGFALVFRQAALTMCSQSVVLCLGNQRIVHFPRSTLIAFECAAVRAAGPHGDVAQW